MLTFLRYRAFWKDGVRMMTLPEVREVERKLYAEYMNSLAWTKSNEN